MKEVKGVRYFKAIKVMGNKRDTVLGTILNPLIIDRTRNSARISNEYAFTGLGIGLGARNALGAESSSRIVADNTLRQCRFGERHTMSIAQRSSQ